jgi:hypothetical protein
MVDGTPSIHPETGIPDQYTVLPFRAPMLVPKILSAAIMSAHHPPGQFAISFESAILVYSHTPANIIIFCTFLASTASRYSLLVYSHL